MRPSSPRSRLSTNKTIYERSQTAAFAAAGAGLQLTAKFIRNSCRKCTRNLCGSSRNGCRAAALPSRAAAPRPPHPPGLRAPRGPPARPLAGTASLPPALPQAREQSPPARNSRRGGVRWRRRPRGGRGAGPALARPRGQGRQGRAPGREQKKRRSPAAPTHATAGPRPARAPLARLPGPRPSRAGPAPGGGPGKGPGRARGRGRALPAEVTGPAVLRVNRSRLNAEGVCVPFCQRTAARSCARTRPFSAPCTPASPAAGGGPAAGAAWQSSRWSDPFCAFPMPGWTRL